MITFKQFLAEETHILAGVIANLLKKGETVRAYVQIWKLRKPNSQAYDGAYQNAMVNIQSVVGPRVQLDNVNWFEFNDDDSDDRMSFRKEDGIWTLRDTNDGPILI